MPKELKVIKVGNYNPKSITSPIFNDLGIIVGRFQVPELHEGHKDFINFIKNRHEKVVIFLGLSPLKCTINNPLDFEARKQMLLEFDKNLTVLYIKDTMDDRVWSEKLDEMISDLLGPNQNAILYGSRDSFIKHYFGKFKTYEYEQKIFISGTDIRNKISAKVKASKDFRHGVIWATNNQWPIAIPTVDMAIFSNENKDELLLGRKKNENKYRFIGGFVSPKETFEEAAIRESNEETNLEIGNLQYLKSFFIDDWRYKNEKNKITTAFFMAQKIFGRPEPGDDIYELRWFSKLDILKWKNCYKQIEKHIVPNHIVLMEYLLKNVLGV